MKWLGCAIKVVTIQNIFSVWWCRCEYGVSFSRNNFVLSAPFVVSVPTSLLRTFSWFHIFLLFAHNSSTISYKNFHLGLIVHIFSWLKKNLFIGHNFLISHMFLIAIFLQNLTEILHDYEPCDIRIFIFAYGLLSFSEDFYPGYKPVVLNTGIIPRRYYSCVFGRS